jgi:hypothetical protein
MERKEKKTLVHQRHLKVFSKEVELIIPCLDQRLALDLGSLLFLTILISKMNQYF